MEDPVNHEERDSSPLSEGPGEEENNRRQSGRVRRKPEFFSSQTFTSSSTKRKRTHSPGEDDGNDASDSGDAGEEIENEEPADDADGEEDQPDEEELREKRRAAKKASKRKQAEGNKKSSSKTKRAPKKPKITNGIETELAFRPLVNDKPKKAKKARIRPSAFTGEEGLYAEVFARGHTTDAVAAEWLTRYEQHNINAMCDLVNFILRATGTRLQATVHDIEDVDNVANRLNDLQEEYQAQGISEYPLISRAQKYKGFQSVLTGFFDSLIQTIHSASVLYDDAALLENIQVWVGSMSSAPIRPFRHTATIISLTIVTSLCTIANQVSATLSNTRKQLDTEKKKKAVNKGRVGALQLKVQDHEKKLETIDNILEDSFNTVFVHRYRDVDPKIRAECINALGLWMVTYRQVFFEGQYLRYMGWVLSDTVPHTRSVVLHQLHRLFQNKDNIPGLRGFTERFRSRIVEMAVRDAESGVRAAAVELSDLIREAGLLEPDDIDGIGRLVLDSEPRVRKAAGKFFVANIEDVYDAQTEGLEEELGESFVDEENDDFKTPKRSWIKFKCLVEILQAYDEQQSELAEDQEETTKPALFNNSAESRFALATESIYPHFQELSKWECLAGYLLYDHSQISESAGGDDSSDSVKRLFKLDDGQEAILIEVLGAAVKLHIQDVAKSDIDKKGRRTKLLAEEMEANQETIAYNLSQIIPQLLNKFGAMPDAASAVLRLEHLVNLDLVPDLQKDSTASYAGILNDINKQFLTHSDRNVLAEATVALLHARSSDELKEIMENQIQELWDGTLDSLPTAVEDKELRENNSMSINILRSLKNTVARISNLATICDCTSILETSTENSRKRKSKLEPTVDILLSLAKRGLRESETDEELERLEQELCTNTFSTLLVYFMWKIKSLDPSHSHGKASFSGRFFDSLLTRRDSFVSTLTAIIQLRKGLDPIRLAAATTLLDLQTAFRTLRHIVSSQANDLDNDLIPQIEELVQHISPTASTLISRLQDSAVKAYAKKIRRTVEIPVEEELPTESDFGASSDEEGESDDEDLQSSARRMREQLLAEQRLCQFTGKVVLAIIARVLDSSGSDAGKLKSKLLFNKARLGHNYKAVIGYLEEEKATTAARSTSKSASKKQTNGVVVNGKLKSAEIVVEDDEDDEIEGDAQNAEDEDDDLRSRGLIEPEGDREEEAEGAESPLTPVDDDIMGD